MSENINDTVKYDADIYVRLSDEDGDKPESNSITNQKSFIREYLKSMPEIRVRHERVDDGFSALIFLSRFSGNTCGYTGRRNQLRGG